MRTTFDEVAVSATKRWIDEAGKKRQKTRKFRQTISPFNKCADGSPKTRDQIMVEIKAQRDSWLAEKE